MITKKIYLYEDRKDVSLTVYLHDTDSEMAQTVKARPSVLVCPGGAYLSCSDREGEPVAMQFLAMGYNAFVLRYSVYFGNGGNAWDIPGKLEPKPELAFPRPMQEIGVSMKMIHDNAEEWGVDPARIAVCGFSAGAHNSAMYSVYYDKPIITDYVGADADYIRPAAAILGYPLTDYTYMDDHTAESSEFDRAFFTNSNIAFLGKDSWTREELIAISPAKLVSQSTPPMFIWTTSKDNLVPTQHSVIMAMSLSEHKIPYDLHIFEEGDHGLSVGTQVSAMSKTQQNKDVAKWIGLAADWLLKRFEIDMPAMLPYEEALANGENPANIF